MNKTDRKVMTAIAKSGFTFVNDSTFRTVRQAKLSIGRLVKAGWLIAVKSAFGTEYKLTDAGREALEYPVTNGLKAA